MSLVVLHRTGHATLAFSAGRVERSAFRCLKQSDEVLREAQTAVRLLHEESEAQIAAESAAANERGFTQGLSDGIVAVLGTLEMERCLRELLADRMADVVEQCVRSMLGEIGNTEVFRQRVRHLLRSNLVGASATLHVCPSQAHLAQGVVAEQATAAGGDLNWLTVYSDDHCKPDALVLETRVGFVDASIDLTLAGARDIISRAVQRTAASLR